MTNDLPLFISFYCWSSYIDPHTHSVLYNVTNCENTSLLRTKRHIFNEGSEAKNITRNKKHTQKLCGRRNWRNKCVKDRQVNLCLNINYGWPAFRFTIASCELCWEYHVARLQMLQCTVENTLLMKVHIWPGRWIDRINFSRLRRQNGCRLPFIMLFNCCILQHFFSICSYCQRKLFPLVL